MPKYVWPAHTGLDKNIQEHMIHLYNSKGHKGLIQTK